VDDFPATEEGDYHTTPVTPITAKIAHNLTYLKADSISPDRCDGYSGAGGVVTTSPILFPKEYPNGH